MYRYNLKPLNNSTNKIYRYNLEYEKWLWITLDYLAIIYQTTQANLSNEKFEQGSLTQNVTVGSFDIYFHCLFIFFNW